MITPAELRGTLYNIVVSTDEYLSFEGTGIPVGICLYVDKGQQRNYYKIITKLSLNFFAQLGLSQDELNRLSNNDTAFLEKYFQEANIEILVKINNTAGLQFQVPTATLLPTRVSSIKSNPYSEEFLFKGSVPGEIDLTGRATFHITRQTDVTQATVTQREAPARKDWPEPTPEPAFTPIKVPLAGRYGDWTRIGYAVFNVPIQAIEHQRIGKVVQHPSMRTASTAKSGAGQAYESFTISYTVNGPKEIKEGLIDVFEQAALMPFTTVASLGKPFNSEEVEGPLEENLADIPFSEVAIKNFTVSTVPQMPDTLQVQITMEPFNWQWYCHPSEDGKVVVSSLDDMICWPLVKLWISSRNRSLLSKNLIRLKDEFTLSLPTPEMMGLVMSVADRPSVLTPDYSDYLNIKAITSLVSNNTDVVRARDVKNITLRTEDPTQPYMIALRVSTKRVWDLVMTGEDVKNLTSLAKYCKGVVLATRLESTTFVDDEGRIVPYSYQIPATWVSSVDRGLIDVQDLNNSFYDLVFTTAGANRLSELEAAITDIVLTANGMSSVPNVGDPNYPLYESKLVPLIGAMKESPWKYFYLMLEAPNGTKDEIAVAADTLARRLGGNSRGIIPAKSTRQLIAEVEASLGKEDSLSEEDSLEIIQGMATRKSPNNTVILGKDIIVERITASRSNNLSTMNNRIDPLPIHQYLGGASSTFIVEGKVFSSEAKAALRDIKDEFDTRALNRPSKQLDFSNGPKVNPAVLKVSNDLFRLLGVSYAMPLDLAFRTIDSQPGVWEFSFMFVEYDPREKTYEQLRYLPSFLLSNRKIEDYSRTSAEREDLSNPYLDKAIEWFTLNAELAKEELYPDMELPTFAELQFWVKTLKIAAQYCKDKKCSSDTEFALSVSDNGKFSDAEKIVILTVSDYIFYNHETIALWDTYKLPPGEDPEGFVDPDFYMYYETGNSWGAIFDRILDDTHGPKTDPSGKNTANQTDEIATAYIEKSSNSKLTYVFPREYWESGQEGLEVEEDYVQKNIYPKALAEQAAKIFGPNGYAMQQVDAFPGNWWKEYLSTDVNRPVSMSGIIITPDGFEKVLAGIFANNGSSRNTADPTQAGSAVDYNANASPFGIDPESAFGVVSDFSDLQKRQQWLRAVAAAYDQFPLDDASASPTLSNLFLGNPLELDKLFPAPNTKLVLALLYLASHEIKLSRSESSSRDFGMGRASLRDEYVAKVPLLRWDNESKKWIVNTTEVDKSNSDLYQQLLVVAAHLTDSPGEVAGPVGLPDLNKISGSFLYNSWKVNSLYFRAKTDNLESIAIPSDSSLSTTWNYIDTVCKSISGKIDPNVIRTFFFKRDNFGVESLTFTPESGFGDLTDDLSGIEGRKSAIINVVKLYHSFLTTYKSPTIALALLHAYASYKQRDKFFNNGKVKPEYHDKLIQFAERFAIAGTDGGNATKLIQDGISFLGADISDIVDHYFAGYIQLCRVYGSVYDSRFTTDAFFHPLNLLILIDAPNNEIISTRFAPSGSRQNIGIWGGRGELSIRAAFTKFSTSEGAFNQHVPRSKFYGIETEARLARKLAFAQDPGPNAGKVWSSYFDIRRYAPYTRLLGAFPSYSVTIINEGFYWGLGNKRLWDQFYTRTGVLSIEKFESRLFPGSTCTVTFSNTWHNLTSHLHMEILQNQLSKLNRASEQKFFGLTEKTGIAVGDYVGKLYHELLLKEVPEDLKNIWANNYLKQLALAPGARLHIRCGYGSNAAKMPVFFNGTVTEVPVQDGFVSVLAAGDGVELEKQNAARMTNVGNSFAFRDTGTLGGGKEPSNIIAESLVSPTLTATLTKGLYRDWSHGIAHFGETYFHNNLRYSVAELQLNIYSSSLTKIEQGLSSIKAFNAIMALTPWNSDRQLLAVDVSEPNPWKIIETCRRACMDFTAGVQPFATRSTLFFGRFWYPYNYTYDPSILDLKNSQSPLNSVGRSEEKINVPYSIGNWTDVSVAQPGAVLNKSLTPTYTFSDNDLTTAGYIIEEIFKREAALGLKSITREQAFQLFRSAEKVYESAFLKKATIAYEDKIIYLDLTLNNANTSDSKLYKNFTTSLAASYWIRNTEGKWLTDNGNGEIAKQIAVPNVGVHAVNSANTASPYLEGVLGTAARGEQVALLESLQDVNNLTQFCKWKMYMQSYLAHPMINLLDVNITPTKQNVYTDAIGQFKYNGVLTPETLAKTVTYSVDSDISAGDRSTLLVDTGLYVTGTQAGWDNITHTVSKGLRYLPMIGGIVDGTIREAPTTPAVHNSVITALADSIKNMYDGWFTISGLPGVKPGDFFSFFDHKTNLRGPLLVKEVIHRLSVEDGFVTQVSPDCVSIPANAKQSKRMYTIMAMGILPKVCSYMAFRYLVGSLMGGLRRLSDQEIGYKYALATKRLAAISNDDLFRGAFSVPGTKEFTGHVNSLFESQIADAREEVESLTSKLEKLYEKATQIDNDTSISTADKLVMRTSVHSQIRATKDRLDVLNNKLAVLPIQQAQAVEDAKVLIVRGSLKASQKNLLVEFRDFATKYDLDFNELILNAGVDSDSMKFVDDIVKHYNTKKVEIIADINRLAPNTPLLKNLSQKDLDDLALRKLNNEMFAYFETNPGTLEAVAELLNKNDDLVGGPVTKLKELLIKSKGNITKEVKDMVQVLIKKADAGEILIDQIFDDNLNLDKTIRGFIKQELKLAKKAKGASEYSSLTAGPKLLWQLMRSTAVGASKIPHLIASSPSAIRKFKTFTGLVKKGDWDTAAAVSKLRLSKAFGSVKDIVTKARMIALKSNPIGLILDISIMSLQEEWIKSLNARLAARQCLIILPLRIGDTNIPYVAGLRGHQGAVFGDDPSWADKMIVNELTPGAAHGAMNIVAWYLMLSGLELPEGFSYDSEEEKAYAELIKQNEDRITEVLQGREF